MTFKRKLVSRVSFVLAVVLRLRSHKRVAAVEFMVQGFRRLLAQRYACSPSTNIYLAIQMRMWKPPSRPRWVVSLAAVVPKLDHQVDRFPFERDSPFGTLVMIGGLSSLTYHGMGAGRINLWSTATSVWNANIQPATSSDCDTHRFVVQTESARCDWQGSSILLLGLMF